MDESKVVRIKRAVQGNFEASPDHYQVFEDRHGFFRKLNETLLARMKLADGGLVLDVGCGTGASCEQILEALPESRVWGLDNSPAMLDRARSRIGHSERLSLVEGDAARLTEYFDFAFDAIIYSASIFLIPDYEESLRQALALLRTGGRVGLTFMEGLYDRDGTNLFALADSSANEGVSLKKPVRLEEFRSFFVRAFPRNEVFNVDFSFPEDLLREFYSVPAMSAGLFPGIDYEDRVRKIARLFDLMPENDKLFRWTIMLGEKTE